MPYTIVQHGTENSHKWAIAVAECDLTDDSDPLVNATIALLRQSYGEGAVVADAQHLLGEAIEQGSFRMDHLITAIREGLPDPEMEGNKPASLTNYRSQAAEMVAKGALAEAYGYQYPAAPQEGSANPNQPVLGFDGWGVLEDPTGGSVLVLIQVKATDSEDSPPRESHKLADECRSAPSDTTAICRALTMLARLLRGDALQAPILEMLEHIGGKEPLRVVVAPAVVRGTTKATCKDLEPIMAIANEISPSTLNAVAVSIGVSLDEFGRQVMGKAREAA